MRRQTALRQISVTLRRETDALIYVNEDAVVDGGKIT